MTVNSAIASAIGAPKRPGEHTHIAIYGAGTLGCFIGGLLLLAERRVTFLARPRIAAELAVHGLLLSDFKGLHARIIQASLDVQTASSCLRDADLVLLTVKSRNTEAAADEIAALTRPDVPVLSLQNGVDNLNILTARLGSKRVIGGMVAFNVVRKGRGHFHRGSYGPIVIEESWPDVLNIVCVPGLNVRPTADIAAVLWGKLLFNLNNGLNALSSLPLREELGDRKWRKLLAAQIAEALQIVKAAGIKPKPSNEVPPELLPRILRLPTPLFGVLARAMMQIDPEARSSTWEDLVAHRPTEVDQFQGAIIRLARLQGLKAPVSEAILCRVKQAEEANAGPPHLSADEIGRCLPAS